MLITRVKEHCSKVLHFASHAARSLNVYRIGAILVKNSLPFPEKQSFEQNRMFARKPVNIEGLSGKRLRDIVAQMID